MKVLFYDDAGEFGGHEIMAVEAAKLLSRTDGVRVAFMFYDKNRRLRSHLESARSQGSDIELCPLRYRSRSLQSIRTLLSPRKIRRIRKMMRAPGPDVVIVVQGTIEISTLGLVAAKRAGYKTLSYIPMAHSMVAMGVRLGVVRDVVNRFFYALPDGYVTISSTIKNSLVARGASPDSVHVVHNAVDFSRYRRCDRAQARKEYGIGEDEYAVALIGRILFSHKGQDILVRAVERVREKLGGCRVLIVGDGPDKDSLLTMVERAGLSGVIRIVPWIDDLSMLYAAIDAVVIPSRFEGVPLAMLEAMFHELPIVASAIDGMAEFLPESWLFPVGNAEAFGRTLLRVRDNRNAELTRRNKELVESQFGVQRFGSDLRRAVLPREREI